MSCSAELVEVLSRLGLSRYTPQFEEEEITELNLLTSMGMKMLRENLEELGMDADAIASLSTALFPEGVGEDGLMLEDNEQPVTSTVPAATEGEDEAEEEMQLESNAPEEPHTGHRAEQEHAQMEAAAADADWLEKPLAVLDPGEAKQQFLAMQEEAHAHFRRKQFANAAAAYTRALGLEVPNAKANATLLYNRATCRHHLNQPFQARQDAQLAAKADHTLVGAWWRAAEASLALGDAATAAEAVAEGLKMQPGEAALLDLRRRVDAA